MDIKTKALFEGKKLPLLIEPEGNGRALDSADLCGWVRDHPAQLRSLLVEHGALLFRGFGMGSAQALGSFSAATGYEDMPYLRGTTPRSKVADRVYTSTDLKSMFPIPNHGEMSYTSVYPRALAFACVVAPEAGGETPIADMERVLQRMPSSIRQEFKKRQIRYTQYVPTRPTRLIQKCWGDMFETRDKSVVEKACADQQVSCEWLAGDTLKLTNVRPATLVHPETQQEVWFNQAHIYHPSFASELVHAGAHLVAVGASLLELLQRQLSSPRLYPHDAAFGDGTPIPKSTMDQVRSVIWAEKISFPWQPGDLLLLDNILVSHGRNPFKGPRKVLASLLGEPARVLN